MHKFLLIPFIASLLCAFALPASASLLGSSVTGSLEFAGSGGLNSFDPVLGFVPSGDLNSTGTTVTISSTDVEFGYDDFSNLDTADFTGSQLLISDLVEFGGANTGFTMSFTDAALAGANISSGADNFPLTYSLNGDVLTIAWAGGDVTAGQQLAASFGIAGANAAVPEPGTFGAMLLAGLAGTSYLAKRSFRSGRNHALSSLRGLV